MEMYWRIWEKGICGGCTGSAGFEREAPAILAEILESCEADDLIDISGSTTQMVSS